MTRLVSRLVRRGFALAMWLGALWLSLGFHADTQLARRAAIDVINGGISEAIRGRITVGMVQSFDGTELVVQDAVLADVRGRPVITARGVRLRLGRLALGEPIRITGASVRDAELTLHDDGSGLPTFIDALAEPESAGEDRESTTGLGLWLRAQSPPAATIDAIDLTRVRVKGELLGLEGIVANIESGSVAIAIGDEVDVHLRGIAGHILEPFGYVARVDQLEGQLSTRADRHVRLQVDVTRDDGAGRERARGRVHYGRVVPGTGPDGAPDEPQLDVRFKAGNVSASTLTGLGFDWMARIDAPVSGPVHLSGPLDRLHLQADVQTRAGAAAITGDFGSPTTSVSLATDGLVMDALVRDGPAVALAGKATLTIPADGPTKLQADVAPLRLWDVALPGFSLSGVLIDDGLQIDRASARQAGASLEASGNVDFDGQARLRIRAQFADVASDPRLRELVPDLHGSMNTDVQVAVTGTTTKRVRLRGRVAIANFRYGGLSGAHMTLEGTAHGHLERPTLAVTVDARSLRAGSYALGDAHLSVDGGPRDYRAIGRIRETDQGTFTLDAHVRATRRGLTIQADPIELRVADGSWRGALRDWSIDRRGRMNLGLLRLANRSQRLEVKGRLHRDGNDHVEAQLQDFDLRAVRAVMGEIFPVQAGRADATVSLSGDLGDPTMLLQGALRDASVGHIEHIEGLYFVSYEEGRLELDSEIDFAERGRITARGHSQFDLGGADAYAIIAHGEHDLEIGAERLSASLLPGKLGTTGATLNTTLHLWGNADDPSVDGDFELANYPVLPEHRATLAGRASYRGERAMIDTEVLDQHGPVGRASLSLALPLASLEAGDLDMRHLLRQDWSLEGELVERTSEAWPARLSDLLPVPVVAASTFELGRKGGHTTGRLEVRARPTEALTDGRCGGRQRPVLSGAITLDGERTRMDLRATVGELEFAQLTGNAEVHIERWLAGGDFALERTSAKLTTDVPAMEELPYLCQLGSGEVRAQATLTNALTEYPRLTARVRTAYLPLAKHQTHRRQVAIRSCRGDPARVWFELNAGPKTSTAHGQLTGCGGRHAEVTVNAPVKWVGAFPRPSAEKPLLGRVAFEGAQLRPLLDRVPGVLTGEAIADGRVVVSGTPDAIRYGGNLRLSQGKLHIIATGQRLENVQAQLQFTGQGAELQQLTAEAGDDGVLMLKGQWAFDNWAPRRAQLALQLTDFPFRHEGSKVAWLTGAAAIEADIQDTHSRTAIKVHALDVRLPNQARTGLQSLDENADIEVIDGQRPTVDPAPYRMDFSIDGTRPISVHREDFETQVASELTISYAAPNARLGGYVEFRRGHFEVLGKDFQILQGGMRFRGDTDFDPGVNLRAHHRLDGGRSIIVVVGGRLSRPKIAFSSESCPGEPGAIALLITGKCADSGLSGRTNEGAEQQFASGLIAGLFTLGARRELGGIIPNLAFESGHRGYATRVRAGVETDTLIPEFMRSVVKKVYVQGAVSAAQQGTDVQYTADNGLLDFLIELYFPHNIVGSGHFTPDTDTWGLDLTWEP